MEFPWHSNIVISELDYNANGSLTSCGIAIKTKGSSIDTVFNTLSRYKKSCYINRLHHNEP